MIVLTEEARKELEWWVENLQLTKGKTLINPQPQITISTDASLEGGGEGGGSAKVKRRGVLGHVRRKKII